MGTDIHAALEYRQNEADIWHAVLMPNRYFGKYEGEPEKSYRWHLDRNYTVFAVLANARNGYGFAGIKTGEPVTPIAPERGFPEDISQEALESCDGYHTPTWLLLSELLAYDWAAEQKSTGIVDARNFEKWDRMKEWNPAPEEWCSDVSGGKTRIVTNEQMRCFIRQHIGNKRGREYEQAILTLDDFHMYTRINWSQKLAATCHQIWENILPPMLKLAYGDGCGPENVRMVMNFDS